MARSFQEKGGKAGNDIALMVSRNHKNMCKHFIVKTSWFYDTSSVSLRSAPSPQGEGMRGSHRSTEWQDRFKRKVEKSFACYAENGLTGTGIKALAKACGCTTGNLYTYFDSVDDLIVESTAYCMAKVEDDFMAKAPTDPNDVMRFIEEVPYWTAKKHGKKYRLMYQIYTHPKYIKCGKKFFEGVNKRYTEYAKQLAPKIGISYDILTPLIFIFIRACVHYAMFEDEYYLNSQIKVLKQGVRLFTDKYRPEYPNGGNEK